MKKNKLQKVVTTMIIDNIVESTSENTPAKSQEITLTEVELDRIERWRQKEPHETSAISYTREKDTTKNTINLHAVYENKKLNPQQQHELHMSTICAATGTASNEYARLLVSQAYEGMFGSKLQETAIFKATQDALLALNPADTYEGMLCTRLVVLHNQCMNFLGRITEPGATNQLIDININRAAKLMRVYNETFDALNKYRRKGEQKITIQHVNVESGGQAVIGDINTGGGVSTKK